MTLKEAFKELEEFSFERCKQKCEEDGDCFDCYIAVEQVKAIDVLRNKVKELTKENLELKEKYRKALSHLAEESHKRIMEGAGNER